MLTLKLPRITDAHIHFRQGDAVQKIVKHSRYCDNVIAMPNLLPPVHDPEQIIHWRNEYQQAIGPATTVHMSAKWLPRTTPADIVAMKNAGAIALKYYPRGGTTHAEDGILFDDLMQMQPQIQDVLGELERQDLPLQCHGEAPAFCLDREHVFLPVLSEIFKRYPKLRLTLEHISTADGILAVRELHSAGCKILGTITAHHTMRTLDNVIGTKLHADEFCMPIPKLPLDMTVIAGAATSGTSCYALGSDSAPHSKSAKYCKDGCAGVFSAPVLYETLVELFRLDDETWGKEQTARFIKFSRDNANAFYGFSPGLGTVMLRQEDWIVPDDIDGYTPFRAGETIKYKIFPT